MMTCGKKRRYGLVQAGRSLPGLSAVEARLGMPQVSISRFVSPRPGVRPVATEPNQVASNGFARRALLFQYPVLRWVPLLRRPFAGPVHLGSAAAAAVIFAPVVGLAHAFLSLLSDPVLALAPVDVVPVAPAVFPVAVSVVAAAAAAPVGRLLFSPRWSPFAAR